MFGCSHHIINEVGTYFQTVSRMPAPLNKNRINLRNVDYLRNYCKRAYRRRILKTIDLHPDDNRKGIRICNHHSIKATKIKTEWFNKHNHKKTSICTMNFPTPLIQPTDENERMNRGIGFDRLLIRHMAQAIIEREKGNVDVVSMLSMAQVFEQNEMTTNSRDELNDTIVHLCGLNLPVDVLKLKCH